MKKETQTVRVAKRLVKYGFITTSEAMSEMYITRLAARIGNIKDKTGLYISVEMIKWGDSRQAKYSRGDGGSYCLRQSREKGELGQPPLKTSRCH